MICLIGAKGKSRRVPGKNLYELGGKTLIARSIIKAKEAGVFGDVVVITEDLRVKSEALKYGANIYDEPEPLTEDGIPLAAALVLLLRDPKFRRNFKDFMILNNVAPFTTPEEIREAVELYYTYPEIKSLTAVMRPRFPLRTSVLRGTGPVCEMQDFAAYKKAKNLRINQKEDEFIQTGSFIIRNIDDFLDTGLTYSKYILVYETSPYGALDIDEPSDLVMAQALWDYKENRI